MPKRSTEEKIEYYLNKIKKIEKRKKNTDRHRITRRLESSSSDEEGNGDNVQGTKDSAKPVSEVEAEICTLQEVVVPIEETGTPDPEIEPEIDPELLSALGESTPDSPDYGDNIHVNLTNIWLPILKKGMSKGDKEKLFCDYLIPDNCRLLQAPKLNAEIAAAVPDMLSKRDNNIMDSQQQLGIGITAISHGIDLLLKGNENRAQAIKHLSNGCRILCDSHYGTTQNRIKLLTPQLDKTCFHTIKDSERDETLFGLSLSEKLKAAKAIEKQGLQIKKPSKPQKTVTPQTATRPAGNQGNWSTPPRYLSTNRGGRGGAKRPTMVSPSWRRPYKIPQSRMAPQDKDRHRASTSTRR